MIWSISALIVSVISLSVSILVAIKARKAIRSLWVRIELQTELTNNLRNNQYRNYADVMGSIEGMKCSEGEKAISFRAQHGEDIWIWRHFKSKKMGFFVEVGAYDGVTFSNTLAFEEIGWKGILIEANPDASELCRKNRPASVVVNAAVGLPGKKDTIAFNLAEGAEMLSFVEAGDDHFKRIRKQGGTLKQVEIPFLSLNQVLDQFQVEEIDFVTIDVEGGELEVLKGFDIKKYKPELLMIENNNARDQSLKSYLEDQTYQLAKRIECNEIYVRIDT
jgi:FkbM family methyltransferase